MKYVVYLQLFYIHASEEKNTDIHTYRHILAQDSSMVGEI